MYRTASGKCRKPALDLRGVAVWTLQILVGIVDAAEQFEGLSAAAALVFIKWHRLLPCVIRRQCVNASRVRPSHVKGRGTRWSPSFNSELPPAILAGFVRRTT